MILNRIASLALLSTSIAFGIHAEPLNLSQVPLYVGTPESPMVMLTMSRDHTLYYEAYNDATDLNDDGVLDTKYKPDQINYYGYFDSFKCYSYDSTANLFSPASKTSDKTCSGTWSGDFLNYLTTSRMDALRKVLFGGKRSSDSSSQTILERATLPQDAHGWGKSYESVSVDGYDLTKYAPLALPSAGKRHLFASTTLGSSTLGGTDVADGYIPGAPLLRVLTNMDEQIWNWVSRERPVAGKRVIKAGTTGTDFYITPTDYVVRVKVCVSGLLEDNCAKYPSASYKPTGLLHKYGETGAMHFGLLTGSFQKNVSGGVLRKIVSSFADEIDSNNGTFKSSGFGTGNGIVQALSSLRVIGFNYKVDGGESYNDNCGWITTAPLASSQCADWGNPVAEMLHETLRYFAGMKSPSASYTTTGGYDTKRADLQLTQATWDDPYASRSWCTPAYNLLISGVNPSYDSDELPGAPAAFQSSPYSSYSGSALKDLDVVSSTNTVSSGEKAEGGLGDLYFIGESLDGEADSKNAPTAKPVTSLANIRGMSPEEPTKGGSFYSAGVSYFGNINDLHPKEGVQTVRNFVVALSSPLPQLRIPVAGQIITLVPYAKSVGGSSINASKGKFQPTNTIVDYYVEELGEKKGVFRINFEDVEQGADHDMDMIVRYTYEVVNVIEDVAGAPTSVEKLKITLDSEYAAGGIDQHAGYIISGTNADGIYLDVKDRGGATIKYYLDTAAVTDLPYPNNARNVDGHASKDADLPLLRSRVFSPAGSTGTSAGLLKSPLWYAAKWGGFNDENKNGKPDGAEWDNDGDNEPDSYFLVTNASKLETQLNNALQKIADDAAGRINAVAFSSGSINTDTLLYAASFETRRWGGEIVAYDISDYESSGELFDKPKWKASTTIGDQRPEDRIVFTRNTESGKSILFDKLSTASQLEGSDENFSAQQVNQLLTGFLPVADSARLAEFNGRVSFLKGDRSKEEAGYYRKRSTVLGDIVDSAPVAVEELDLVAVGANDGMVHVLKGTTGQEKFAYIPTPVFANLHHLTSPTYAHRNYVNAAPVVRKLGDSETSPYVLVGGLGSGGQGIYALNLSAAKSVTASESAANAIVMWEFTDKDDPDLGYTYGSPVITKLNAGGDARWVVVFGNGYNNSVADANGSGNGQAALFVVDAETGEKVYEISTSAGTTDDPNGLTAPFVTDYDRDGYADYAYAGDLQGNLWAFDLRSGEIVHHKDGAPAPLYVAKDSSGKSQAITAPPTAAYHPNGGLIVLFGTGKYLENSDNHVDKSADPRHSYYAVWDNLESGDHTPVSGRGALQEQTIDYEGSGTRLTSKNSFVYGDGPTDKKGWYLDFISPVNKFEGERLVTKSNLRFNKVSFTTLIPSEAVCAAGGRGWFMELDIFYGAMWSKVAVYDKDGKVITDKLPLVSNKEVKGVAGATSTVLYGEKMDALSVTPSSGQEPLMTVEPDEPKGRQSWLQLF